MSSIYRTNAYAKNTGQDQHLTHASQARLFGTDLCWLIATTEKIIFIKHNHKGDNKWVRSEKRHLSTDFLFPPVPSRWIWMDRQQFPPPPACAPNPAQVCHRKFIYCKKRSLCSNQQEQKKKSPVLQAK